MASVSLTFPRHLCVVARLAWRRMILETISIGVPDLLAYVVVLGRWSDIQDVLRKKMRDETTHSAEDWISMPLSEIEIL